MSQSEESFDVESIRKDFPILSREAGKHPFVYLDNAATSQKPRAVIERLTRYYESENANVHRGIHSLSQIATEAYEASRQTIAQAVNATSADDIVFVRGTTEGINLVAQSFARPRLRAGDEILLTEMEHHANIVPWQIVAEQTGAVIKVIPVNEVGELDLSDLENLLSERTRILSFVHTSNALGTINPAETLIARARQVGAHVLVDAAQLLPHSRVDVQALDCDFLVFSGHKVYGPTGIGVLYGKPELLQSMPPYQGGGDMIAKVSFSGTTFKAPPTRFEAGTPHIAGVIGLGAAFEYLSRQNFSALKAHEQSLLTYGTQALGSISGLRIIGQAAKKISVLSFVIDGIHPNDIATWLDEQGIAVRTGHHCTMPLMERFGISGTVRASVAFYNTQSELERFVSVLEKGVSILRS